MLSRGYVVGMVNEVKCPICKKTVPFSLQMHMQMVHGTGKDAPNRGKVRFIEDPTARPMNERKPAAARKQHRKKKAPPRKKGAY